MTHWNATALTFTDISVEEFREYRFPGGEIVRVDNPTHLHVSASGGHRIATQDGKGVYIPAGFMPSSGSLLKASPFLLLDWV